MSIVDTIRKALFAIKPSQDKLPRQGKAAVAALWAMVGYGAAKGGELDKDDNRTALVAVKTLVASESLLDKEAMSALRAALAALQGDDAKSGTDTKAE